MESPNNLAEAAAAPRGGVEDDEKDWVTVVLLPPPNETNSSTSSSLDEDERSNDEQHPPASVEPSTKNPDPLIQKGNERKDSQSCKEEHQEKVQEGVESRNLVSDRTIFEKAPPFTFLADASTQVTTVLQELVGSSKNYHHLPTNWRVRTGGRLRNIFYGTVVLLGSSWVFTLLYEQYNNSFVENWHGHDYLVFSNDENGMDKPKMLTLEELLADLVISEDDDEEEDEERRIEELIETLVHVALSS